MDHSRFPELLATYLDALEGLIHKELQDPRADHVDADGIPWRVDLQDALAELTAAREELNRCPEGSRLAFHVVAVQLGRLRMPAEKERLRRHGGLKGAKATKPRRTQRASELHEEIRQAEANLNPKLTANAKAAKLARKFDLSESRIRHIISKGKT